MARMTENNLTEIVRREVQKYEGTSPHAKIYLLMDDDRHTYAITGIENEPVTDRAFIIIQAHIDGDQIVIDEDNLWDKQLWKALVQAGVPREQIVLAYAGEQVPMTSEG